MIGKHVVIDTLDNFKTKLDLIPSSAIVLIKDVGQIYAHGTYFGAQKTYSLLTKTADGLAPKGGTSASSLIKDGESEWVLTVTNGENPTWRKLPDNAFSSSLYTLPSATASDLGGIKVGQVYTATFDDLVGQYYKINVDKNGLAYVHVPWINNPYTASGSGITLKDNVFSLSLNSATKLDSAIGNKIYAVSLDKNGKLCVSVPWTDTNNIFVGATETKNGSSGMVPAPIANQHRYFLRGDGTWVKPNLSDLNDDVVAGKYLSLSGGAIDGWVHIRNNKSSEGTLRITGVSTKPIIRFEGDFSWGYLGFGGANNPCYYDNSLNEYNLIHSGNYSSYALSLKGGTLDGVLTIRAASATSDSWIEFSNKSDSVVHKLGIRRPESKYGLQYYNGSEYYKIWHEGNFTPSHYLPKSDGIVSGKLSFENTNTYVVYNKINKYIEVFNNTGMSGIAFGDDGTNKVYSNGWKTIIHEGNIGNQSVTYAARAGSLVNSSNQSIVYLSGDRFYIGDSIYDATETHILGKQVRLRGGSSATLGLTVDSNGDTFIEELLNVKGYININRNGATGNLYNTSNLAFEIQPYASYVAFRAYKSGKSLNSNMLVFTDKSNLLVGTSVDNGYTFQVNGGIYANANLCVDTTGGGVLVGGLGNTIDGYSASTSSYSTLHLNYTSSYNLSLCNGGGSVCIGNSQGDSTKKLDVKGHIALTGYLYMSDNTSTYRTAIDKTGNTILFGYGQSIANYDVQYLGYNIRLYAGGGHNTSKGIDILANGNVGIGTANPSCKLDVKGQIASYENLIYQQNTKKRITLYGENGIGRIYNYDEENTIYGDMYIGKNGTDAITIKGDTFNVGINNASPNYKLDVNGSTYIGTTNEGICISKHGNTIDAISSNGSSLPLYLNHSSTGDIRMVIGGGNVGIGTTSPAQKLHVNGHIWSDGDIGAQSKIIAYGNVIAKGNIGVGTESPAYKLDVKGTIASTSTNNSVRMITDADCGLYMTSSGQWLHLAGKGSSMFIYNGEWDSKGRGNYNKGIVINTSNNVGIGTERPVHKLDVNGTIYGDHYYGNQITLYTRGNGTYTRAWITAKDSAGDFIIEAPLTAESSGTRAPITLTWRGGYPAMGGLKITGYSEAELGKNKIWHAGNDGSGSGLNADLLDGYHISVGAAGTNSSTIYFVT